MHYIVLMTSVPHLLLHRDLADIQDKKDVDVRLFRFNTNESRQSKLKV